MENSNEPKSLEQEVDVALAEENGKVFDGMLKDVKAELSRHDLLISQQAQDIADLDRALHATLRDLNNAVRRLDYLDPSYRQTNCEKCGRKITNPKGKCGVCGHDNK